MDAQSFSRKSPGKLIPASAEVGGLAFLPNPLPPRWSVPADLYDLIIEARAAVAELNGIGRTIPDHRLLLKPLQQREALTSSSLEGTYCPPDELILAELDTGGARRKARPQPTRRPASFRVRSEAYEVRAFGRALDRGIELLAGGLPLCSRVFCEMHDQLMSGFVFRQKRPGNYRNAPVMIGTEARFVPPPGEHVPELIANLEAFIQPPDESGATEPDATARFAVDPLVRSLIAHYQFETIHPFLDGNGRIGRAILSLMIQNLLGHDHPWLYVSAFIEEHKSEYIEALFNVSAKGDWTRWIRFGLRAIHQQATDGIVRCQQFNELQADFQNRLDAEGDTVAQRLYRVVDLLFAQPIVTPQAIAERLGLSTPTARTHLKRLAELGILTERPGTRPLQYRCDEVMAIAYGDLRQRD